MNDAVLAPGGSGLGDGGAAGLVSELRQILNPRSVAVVGASSSPTKFGYFFTQCFVEMGFTRLYPINPRETEVLGLRAYPTVRDVPDEVDLAFVVTPTEAVLPVVADCGAKGVKGIVVYTSGFAEKGPEGARLQRQLVEVARQHGARIIGPNCMGIYAPKARLSYYPGMPKESGAIAMISQSGSLSIFVVWTAQCKGLHFDTVVSCGNEADLNMADFLEYFGADPKVEIIAAYLEGMQDGRRFLRLARDISRRKPIIALKGGTTDRGGRAANSHTGALAGSNRVWKAVFDQAGIVTVDSLEEMVDALLVFSRVPAPSGPRVAIVSGPGGPAVLSADACAQEGLEVAELSEATKRRLAGLMPAVGTNPDNPVDLGMGTVMDPSVYRLAIEVLAADRNVDVILAIGSCDTSFGQVMVATRDAINRPLLVAGLLPPERFSEGYLYLTANGIAAYPDPRRAIRALARLYRFSLMTQ
ncbi:MAG: acetate--CoA ligase family protein [Chloroflexota bacterium]